jgi:hypothetical protein
MHQISAYTKAAQDACAIHALKKFNRHSGLTISI